MVDRPILFSAPMVRALLAGNKTQTRRALKPQPARKLIPCHFSDTGWANATADELGCTCEPCPSPRFAIGDRLWVKETWRTWRDFDDIRPNTLPAVEAPVFYEADRDNCDRHGKARVSIHMPRWASRLTLTVTDVRVQRLQDISEADCLAEGAKIAAHANLGRGNSLNGVLVETDQPHVLATPRCWYRELWDSINGAGAWDANPWVVAVSFDVRKGNIDA